MGARVEGAAALWTRVGTRWLPFADAATEELPLARLLRLGLFQLSVALSATLLAGTLNRVMIVELGVPATLVAAMLALPFLAAPLRALVGHRSDTHRSVLGWRRVPYLWFGSLAQFGGLAIMPFALILLSGDTRGTRGAAVAIAGLAFVLVGAGAHTVQTAGLALATDLAPAHARPRVVALLHLMLLAGTLASALALGALLADFSALRLVQVVQGCAVATMALNVVALWKQEARRPRTRAALAADPPRARLRDAWRALAAGGGAVRLLVAVAIGGVALAMQDALLEPYGARVLGLGVGETTALTALFAAGAIASVAVAARALGRGADPIRVAAAGALAGVAGLAAVVFASPLQSAALFRAGAAALGLADGLFAVGTLTAAAALRDPAGLGVALGAWGAVAATAEGLGLAAAGALRDAVQHLADAGALGEAMRGAAPPYGAVFHLEIALLFAALVALGPLARRGADEPAAPRRFGLAELPG